METKDKLLHLCALSEFARTGPKKPPQRLNAFLRNAGGLRNDRGELTRIFGKASRSMPGLINGNGQHLDDATHYAWEAGFIPSQDRPFIDELLELLERDLNGDPVYSCDDAQQAYEYEQAMEARSILDRLGILADHPSKQIKVERALLEYAGTVQ